MKKFLSSIVSAVTLALLLVALYVPMASAAVIVAVPADMADVKTDVVLWATSALAIFIAGFAFKMVRRVVR